MCKVVAECPKGGQTKDCTVVHSCSRQHAHSAPSCRPSSRLPFHAALHTHCVPGVRPANRPFTGLGTVMVALAPPLGGLAVKMYCKARQAGQRLGMVGAHRGLCMGQMQNLKVLRIRNPAPKPLPRRAAQPRLLEDGAIGGGRRGCAGDRASGPGRQQDGRTRRGHG